MNIGERIVQKFGGTNAMARKLSQATGRRVPPTTVQYWSDCGHIPSGRQNEVLSAARFHGIDLSPNDFFPAAAE